MLLIQYLWAWGFCSSVIEDSLLRYDLVSLANWFLMFWRNAVPMKHQKPLTQWHDNMSEEWSTQYHVYLWLHLSTATKMPHWDSHIANFNDHSEHSKRTHKSLHKELYYTCAEKLKKECLLLTVQYLPCTFGPLIDSLLSIWCYYLTDCNLYLGYLDIPQEHPEHSCEPDQSVGQTAAHLNLVLDS